MASKPLVLGSGPRIADYLSVGLLARLIPPSLVGRALTAHGRHSQRERDFPAHAVVYYVMALSLYRNANTEEVLRVVTAGMEHLGAGSVRRIIGKSGMSAARARLGADVMRYLAEQALTPLAEAGTPGAFYRGLRLVSLDGTTLEVADEAANRETFGRPGTQQGETGYPQIRCAGLVENGTHALFGIALGGYREAEVSLAQQAVAHLRPGMLCWADRGLTGFPLWQAAAKTGAQRLGRVAKNRRLPALKRFADGSYLSRLEPAPLTQKTMGDTPTEPLTVRVIDYRLPGVEGAEPIDRLITTLLDPEQAPAQELAVLDQARWTIDTTFAELKTTLKGADIVLRSKTPERVRQEFWGVLLAHHAVRRTLPIAGAISPSAVPIVVARAH